MFKLFTFYLLIMKCPECGSKNIKKEDDGRNILIFCGDCGFVVNDEILVS